VGASGWDYRVPYAGSIEATLIAAQEQALASGEYIWPWESFDPEDFDEDLDSIPRPSSLAELGVAKETEEFWEEGTHSILDIAGVIAADAADDDWFSTISPLSAAELNQVFGTEQPGAGDFDRVYEPGPGGPLATLMGSRWTGRSMVIYKDGAPAEVFFWGFSGD
jgi:hypothetical protein